VPGSAEQSGEAVRPVPGRFLEVPGRILPDVPGVRRLPDRLVAVVDADPVAVGPVGQRPVERTHVEDQRVAGLEVGGRQRRVERLDDVGGVVG
jgi:hypothetical protein